MFQRLDLCCKNSYPSWLPPCLFRAVPSQSYLSCCVPGLSPQFCSQNKTEQSTFRLCIFFPVDYCLLCLGQPHVCVSQYWCPSTSHLLYFLLYKVGNYYFVHWYSVQLYTCALRLIVSHGVVLCCAFLYELYLVWPQDPTPATAQTLALLWAAEEMTVTDSLRARPPFPWGLARLSRPSSSTEDCGRCSFLPAAGRHVTYFRLRRPAA